MSVPSSRQKLLAAIACCLGLGLTAIAVAAPPVGVKRTTRNEQAPAAGGEWFAWSKSRQRQTSPFDVWAQKGSERAFKVNATRTQAYTGGIEGTSLVYQQIRGVQGDIKLFDLAARKHRPLPSGVNTTRWECCPTISGDWLLFSRGVTYSPTRQLVILRNLATGEQRILDNLVNRNGLLSAGQVSGAFAVWARCNPYPRCRIVRYNIVTKTAAALSGPAGKVAYSPSVSSTGTAYFARSNRGCGKGVQLVKQTSAGEEQVLVALPPGQDIDVTYARLEPSIPEAPTTKIYYDRNLCRSRAWDIFRIDDVELLPPPSPTLP